MTIDTVLTHGKAGSVSGTFTSADDQEVAFCDIYEFAGHSKTAKLKKITSYWIPLVAA